MTQLSGKSPTVVTKKRDVESEGGAHLREDDDSSGSQSEKKNQYFMCPMYVNFMKNRNFSQFGGEHAMVCRVPIPSKEHETNFWIKRGVCLLCYSESLDD